MAEKNKIRPKFYVVFIETVDPKLIQEYDEGIAFLVEKMYAANIDFESWAASQHNESYYWILGINSLDELQTVNNRRRVKRLMEAVGADNRDRWAATTGPAVTSTATFVVERVEELSYQPKKSIVENPKYANVDIQEILGTQNTGEYKALIMRALDAARKAEYPLPWSAYQVVIGDGGTCYGDPNAFYYVTPFETMSQYYEEHPFLSALEKTLGKKEARKLLNDVMKCQEKVEKFDFKLRPELSYRPGLY